jgi:hypothetical protein
MTRTAHNKDAVRLRWAPAIRLPGLAREADTLHPRHRSGVCVETLHVGRRRKFMEVTPVDPWYRATTPRREVREGRSFNPDEFAIALEQVVAGTAPADYRDPGRFFARTYVTAAMRAQIGTVLRRLQGETERAPPVLSLVTQFGGGKTHSLTALWHLAALGDDAARLPGVPELLLSEHLAQVPRARRAVFVGNAWDPSDAYATPWLDLAWQLAGEAGLRALGTAAASSPPGTDALARLFAHAGQPVLILMDEVLNFINRHRSLADPFYGFLDNLIRAATSTRHVAVVLSLPQAALEMTAREQEWQARITKIVKRVASDLIGADESEISEIIRRRLFEDTGSDHMRALVAKSYADWCFEHHHDLPPQWTSVDPALTERRAREVLIDRFAACYPFHPATLSVFRRKWHALPQFQRTRGTLGLLALWLSRRYADDQAAARTEPLITLGAAPLEDPAFRAAVIGQLGEPRLRTAIEADLVGETAHAAALDADTKGPLRGIHRQVGGAILFEGAVGQTDQAASLPELRFALGGPLVDTTSIDVAAAALENRAFFIRQVGADGYRLGTHPKLNKVVADKRASLDQARDVLPEVRRIVRQLFEAGSPVPVVLFPYGGASVRDTRRLTLLVADPTLAWTGDRTEREHLADWTYRRGRQARLYPASLIWCLREPDQTLFERIETALAWRAVRQDLAAGLLGADTDPQDARGIEARIRSAEQDAREAVWAAYRYLLLADRQEPHGLRLLDLGAGHSSSRESLAGRALAALRAQGLLNDTIGAAYVERKWPPAFAGSGAWPLSALRQSFLDGSMTRLIDVEHYLRARIAEWVDAGDFGLASGSGSGGYRRVWYREIVPLAEINFDPDIHLLSKSAVERHQVAETDTAPPRAAPNLGTARAGNNGSRAPTEAGKAVRLSIAGEVPVAQWNRIGTQVLSRLGGSGDLRASISLTCEIDAAEWLDLRADLDQAIQALGLAGRLTLTPHAQGGPRRRPAGGR